MWNAEQSWSIDRAAPPAAPGMYAPEPRPYAPGDWSRSHEMNPPGAGGGAPISPAAWQMPGGTAAPAVAQQGVLDWVANDPLIGVVVALSALILAYQLIVMVLHPSFLNLSASTDWLRAFLAWLEMIPVWLAAVALYRARRSEALPWFMFALAMFSYAIAQNWWAVNDQIIFKANPLAAPFPNWPDLFYLLQYPFFFLALALLPGVSRRGQPGIARVKVILDSILLMAAGTALSWYFILAPLYLQSSQSVLGKATNLAYPVGDLGLLFGLAVVVARQGSRDAGRVALRVLIASVIALILADSWYAYLNLYSTYVAGDIPDAFWIICYLLFALAGLVRWRMAQQEEAQPLAGASRGETSEYRPAHEVAGTFRLLVPFIAALAASALIVSRAAIAPIGTRNLLIPFGVSFGLVVLVLMRQGITVLENEQLLRSEQQRAEELALAHQVAEEQRRLLAERNQRLERDIEHLKDVHARVARGDTSARARIDKGELLPIAGSLNLMLDRLSNLSRINVEHARLDHAIQLVVEAAQGLAMNDDRALAALASPTNTPLDGVAIALSQLRARIKEMSAGLRQLEQARQAAHELTEMAMQQGQFITNEAVALGGSAGALSRLATELEQVAQVLEHLSGALPPAQRQLTQIIGVLQMLVRVARQQIKNLEEQVARFAEAEQRAQVASIGTRRLAAELDAAARSGGSRVTFGMPGVPESSMMAGTARFSARPMPDEDGTGG